MDDSLKFAKRWVITGVVCGFFAGISYAVSIAISLPPRIAYPVFWAFGPRDKEGISLEAAYRLIKGAVKGVKGR